MAILLTASPPGCLRHLFQICRIQFTSVSRHLCICICIPNSFRTRLSSILSFPFPPLPYHTDDVCCPFLLPASFLLDNLGTRDSICDSHTKRIIKRFSRFLPNKAKPCNIHYLFSETYIVIIKRVKLISGTEFACVVMKDYIVKIMLFWFSTLI